MENTRSKLLKLSFSSPVRYKSLVMRLRVWAISILVRILMMIGYVVVIVGKARSGKTLILNRATPNKILDKSKERLSTGMDQPLTVEELPDGYFSIDEANQFAPRLLAKTLTKLTNRSFAISFQRISDLERIASALRGRRVVVVQLTM